MNGHEVDRAGELGIAVPELPDIRVGHRARHRGFDLADDGGEVHGRQLAAQQDLVSDHDRGDRLRVAPGQRDRAVDLDAVFLPLGTEPKPEHHLHTQRRGDRRHLVDAVLGRIGADTVRELPQAAQVLLDLPGRDMRARLQGILVLAERRIGDALQRSAVASYLRRHVDRASKPPPRRDDRRHGSRKQAEGQFNHKPG